MYNIQPDPFPPGKMVCPTCRGFGIHEQHGDVVDCRECGGGGIVPKRDDKGRFEK